MTTTVSLTIERIKVKATQPKPERDKRPRRGSMVAVRYPTHIAGGRVIVLTKDGRALIEATSNANAGQRYDCPPKSWHPNPAQLLQWDRELTSPPTAIAISTGIPADEPIHSSLTDASMGPGVSAPDPRQEDSR